MTLCKHWGLIEYLPRVCGMDESVRAMQRAREGKSWSVIYEIDGRIPDYRAGVRLQLGALTSSGRPVGPGFITEGNPHVSCFGDTHVFAEL